MENSVMDRPVTDRHVAVQSILARSVVLVLSCSYFGNTRKVKLDDAVRAATEDGDAVTKDSVEEQLHVTKRLVDRKTISRAMAVGGAVKAYLRTVAIPAHRVFGERAYLVPVEIVEQVDARLREFVEVDLAAALVDLKAEWNASVARQAIALGPLFKASDYPTAEEAAARFGIDWSYVSFAAPERLEHVSVALFDAAQKRFEGRMAEAYDEVKMVLRETLHQLVVSVGEKLVPGEDGKPKVFRNTILDGLTEFLSTFRIRNISDDHELETVVERLRSLTSGLDPQALRDIAKVREDVLAGVREAADHLDALVQTGRRGISFGSL